MSAFPRLSSATSAETALISQHGLWVIAIHSDSSRYASNPLQDAAQELSPPFPHPLRLQERAVAVLSVSRGTAMSEDICAPRFGSKHDKAPGGKPFFAVYREDDDSQGA